MRSFIIFVITAVAALGLAMTAPAQGNQTQPPSETQQPADEGILDRAESGLRDFGQGVADAINALDASVEEHREQSQARRRRRHAAAQASGEAVASARASAEAARTEATPATEENALDRTERELEEIGESVGNTFRGLFNRE